MVSEMPWTGTTSVLQERNNEKSSELIRKTWLCSSSCSSPNVWDKGKCFAQESKIVALSSGYALPETLNVLSGKRLLKCARIRVQKESKLLNTRLENRLHLGAPFEWKRNAQPSFSSVGEGSRCPCWE